MSVEHAAERYPLPARTLHWLMAFAIPLQFWLGWAIDRAVTHDSGARLNHLHNQVGLVLAALLVMRLSWRLARPASPPLHTEPRWRRRLAALTHWALYATLLILPASGYVMRVWRNESMDVLGLFELPRLFESDGDLGDGYAAVWYLHYWTGWMLAMLVTLHVAAAIWHQWVLRDGLIRRRMW